MDFEFELEPTVYFARRIVSGDEIIHHGAIRVEDGIITDVGPKSGIRRQGDRILNLGNRTLLPGFINLHTTLEESALRGQLSNTCRSPRIYRKRAHELINELNEESSFQLEKNAALTIRESLSNGITTQVTTNRTLSGEFLEMQPAHIISLTNTAEIFGATQFLFARSVAQKIKEFPTSHGFSVPFLHTHTRGYLKEAQRMLNRNRYHHQIILNESSEELSAYLEHRGEFYDEVCVEKEWPFANERSTAARIAIKNSLIPRHSTIIHPNYCGTDELVAFQSLSSSVAVSPRFTQFFDMRPFPVGGALDNRVNIAITTASPALCLNMNLLDELFEVRECHPSIPAETLLDMITRNPAKALRMDHELGSLTPGKRANIIGIRSNDLSSSPLDDLIQGEIAVECVIIDGEELIVP